MKKFIKELFCWHKWIIINKTRIDTKTGKKMVFTSQCKNCDKISIGNKRCEQYGHEWIIIDKVRTDTENGKETIFTLQCKICDKLKESYEKCGNCGHREKYHKEKGCIYSWSSGDISPAFEHEIYCSCKKFIPHKLSSEKLRNIKQKRR